MALWAVGVQIPPPTPIYLEKRRLGTRTVHRMAARVCPLSARWNREALVAEVFVFADEAGDFVSSAPLG